MQKLSDFFYNKSSLLIAFGFTVLSFSYLFIIMMHHAKSFAVPNGDIFLGTSFGFTYKTVLTFLSGRDAVLLAHYKSFLSTTDIIYPVLYGLQYVIWISFLYKPLASKSKSLNLLGILPAAFDWLENFQLITLTNQFLKTNSIVEFDVELASFFSVTKWITTSIVFMIILCGIYFRIRLYLNKKKST